MIAYNKIFKIKPEEYDKSFEHYFLNLFSYFAFKFPNKVEFKNYSDTKSRPIKVHLGEEYEDDTGFRQSPEYYKSLAIDDYSLLRELGKKDIGYFKDIDLERYPFRKLPNWATNYPKFKEKLSSGDYYLFLHTIETDITNPKHIEAIEEYQIDSPYYEFNLDDLKRSLYSNHYILILDHPKELLPEIEVESIKGNVVIKWEREYKYDKFPEEYTFTLF